MPCLFNPKTKVQKRHVVLCQAAFWNISWMASVTFWRLFLLFKVSLTKQIIVTFGHIHLLRLNLKKKEKKKALDLQVVKLFLHVWS